MTILFLKPVVMKNNDQGQKGTRRENAHARRE